MEPKDYIYMSIIFIALLGIVGTLVMDTADNYEKNVSNEFSEVLTGYNYSEFQDLQDDQDSGISTDDGVLAEYRAGEGLDLFNQNTLNKIKSAAIGISNFMNIGFGIKELIITLLVTGVVVGGIYFLRNRI